MSPSWTHLYVVYRIDHFLLEEGAVEDLADAVTIKEILPSEEEAIREVERLNALRNARSEYFFASAKYYPEGRARQENA